MHRSAAVAPPDGAEQQNTSWGSAQGQLCQERAGCRHGTLLQDPPHPDRPHARPTGGPRQMPDGTIQLFVFISPMHRSRSHIPTNFHQLMNERPSCVFVLYHIAQARLSHNPLACQCTTSKSPQKKTFEPRNFSLSLPRSIR